MTWAIRILFGTLAAVLTLGAVWTFGPREPVAPPHGAIDLPDDLDAHLATREAAHPDITPGAEAEIVWAGAPGAKTPVSIVYLHGFSATKHEIRPVPDLLAARFGANVFYARLAGHGRPGAALGEVRVPDWRRDVAEALAIGRRIGERMIVVATSTGATLATLELAENPADVAGVVMVSPNFRVKGAPEWLMTAPFARHVLPLALGAEREWEPMNEEQAKWWTWRYPLAAVMPMAAAVRAARDVDHAAMTTPVLFVFSDEDQVVDHAATRAVAAAWGGPVTIHNPTPAATDSPSKHVVAGDITSPSLTVPVAEKIGDWAENLPQIRR